MLYQMELNASEHLPEDAFNRIDPGALINLVPVTVQSAMIKAHSAEPDLFGCDEHELFRKLRLSNRLPSATDNRIRLAFWMEFERSRAEGREMAMSNVYGGICSNTFFNGKYLASQSRVAWLLCIPAHYDVMMEEGVSFGVELLRSYLEVDAMAGGKPNIKLMELHAKIVAMLDMRLKGGHIQRSENKTLNLNVSTSDRRIAQVTQELSMEALEKRMKELDKRERAIQGGITQGVVLEREPTDDSSS